MELIHYKSANKSAVHIQVDKRCEFCANQSSVELIEQSVKIINDDAIFVKSCVCFTGLGRTFRFKLPAIRRVRERHRTRAALAVSTAGAGLRRPTPTATTPIPTVGPGPTTVCSDIDSHGSSFDDALPLQPFSPFADRLRIPSSRTRHPVVTPSGTDHSPLQQQLDQMTPTPAGGGDQQPPAVIGAWRGSQGSLRKQSSIEETAGSGVDQAIVASTGGGGGGITPASATAANNWRLSPVPPVGGGVTRLDWNTSSGTGEMW